MNKIQKFALENGKIDINGLCMILESIEYNQSVNLDYVISVILGLEDVKKNVSSIPTHSKCAGRNNDTECEIVAYMPLSDSVEFRYKEPFRLWFSNEEDANKFTNGESYYNLDYKYSEREGYPYPGQKILESTGYCTRKEWLDNAVKEE